MDAGLGNEAEVSLSKLTGRLAHPGYQGSGGDEPRDHEDQGPPESPEIRKLGPRTGQEPGPPYQSLSPACPSPLVLGQRFVLVQAWKYQKYQKLKASLFGRPQHKTNQHDPAINLD